MYYWIKIIDRIVDDYDPILRNVQNFQKFNQRLEEHSKIKNYFHSSYITEFSIEEREEKKKTNDDFDTPNDTYLWTFLPEISYFRQPCLKEELLCKFSEPVQDCCHKVTVVGAGMVGVAIVNALIFQVNQLFFFSSISLIFIFSSFDSSRDSLFEHGWK